MTKEDFLIYAGENYNSIKKKWTTRLKKQGLSFSEDIFQESIIKVHSYLSEKPYTGDVESYWWQTFINNSRREKDYAYNSKKDDTIEVLQYLDNFPTEDKPILLQDIEEGLKLLTDMEKNLLLIYYLTDITYTELEELTGIKDVRYKLKGILKKVRKKI